MSADKATNPQAAEDTAPASNERIATYFAATYANMVNTEGGQEDLYRLYGANAELSHVTPEGTMKAKSVKAIKEQLSSRSSLASNIDYTSINVQEGYKKCVIVLATGVQSRPESAPRPFSQVFVLVPQPEGFYCNNDLFVVQEPLAFAPVPEEPVANGDADATTVDSEEEIAANGEVAATEPAGVEEGDGDESEAAEAEEPAAVDEPSEPAPAPAPAPTAVQEQAQAAPEAVVVADEPAVVAAPAKVFSYASLAAQPKTVRAPPKAKPAQAAPAPAQVKKEAEAVAAPEEKQAAKPQRARTQPQPQNQVFIRPIKQGAEQQLTTIFQAYGTVEKVQLKEQGFGFVTFSDADAVAKAIADGEVTCDNERVIVEGMKPQKPGSAGRGRGRSVRGGGRGGDARRGGAKPKAA